MPTIGGNWNFYFSGKYWNDHPPLEGTVSSCKGKQEAVAKKVVACSCVLMVPGLRLQWKAKYFNSYHPESNNNCCVLSYRSAPSIELKGLNVLYYFILTAILWELVKNRIHFTSKKSEDLAYHALTYIVNGRDPETQGPVTMRSMLLSTMPEFNIFQTAIHPAHHLCYDLLHIIFNPVHFDLPWIIMLQISRNA